MAEGRSTPKRIPWDRPFSPVDEGVRLWRWVLFSSLVHAVLIWGLFVIPPISSRRTTSYPVYTVDLVGGEKIGGTTLGSVVAPAEKKRETTKAKAESLPREEKVKELKKKATERTAQMSEEVALKKSKKEVTKADQGLPAKVREKLIESAMERVRERSEGKEKKQKEEPLRSGPGEGVGAAAKGSGGTGGGIVRGIEFIRYYSEMLQRIKNSWTWVGKRADLEVKVRFGIQENGEIVGLKITKPSGDRSYDDSVVRAVRRASPLPPPPEDYRKDFADVELIFQPKDLGS